MQKHQTFLLRAAQLLLLAAPPLVAAHGHDEGMKMGMAGGMDISATMEGAAASEASALPVEPTYFRHEHDVWLAYAHISLMMLAWVMACPVSVMLSIARSRFTLLGQAVFLVLNGLGMLVGIVYNHRTPDLYEHNVHHTAGWIVSALATAWATLAVLRAYVARHGSARRPSEGDARSPLTTSLFASITHQALAKHEGFDPDNVDHSRWSNDSGQGTERNTASLCSPRSMSLHPDDETPPAWKSYGQDDEDGAEGDEGGAEQRGFLQNTSVDRFLASRLSSKHLSSRSARVFDSIYSTLDRLMILFGFFGLVSGLVTFSGIFQGTSIFNGLAHFIKGAIFFWYGLLTFGRWMGCFADYGWAWNLKPPAHLVGRTKARIPTAEFTESFVIFFYGASNVFLEHLAAWGSAWTAMDLEHLSITIMFFGGGLLGMLVESKGVRKLVSSALTATEEVAFASSEESDEKAKPSVWRRPDSYMHPLNPLPGLIILLLGLMMSSHTQQSMVSSMIHKQWGTLFVGFALARGFTYVIFWLKPPMSYLPTRPPTEIVSAFCLISGGMIFMASNRDTVQAVERYGLDAMFVFTVMMGWTALIMAWTVVVIAIKGWAVRYEQRRNRVSMPRATSSPA